MPLVLDWTDIALRLGLTFLAGALFGLDRGIHGHIAGLRTTILVALAASLAMIQANLLLATVGKDPSSFVNMDVMRLPLGILSGMGFIGGGAILRRDSIVLGVTTAATLWFVTVVGLCFGGGQLGLGLGGLSLGLIVLRLFKLLEYRLMQEQLAELTVTWRGTALSVEGIQARLQEAGMHIGKCKSVNDVETDERMATVELTRHARPGDHTMPPLVGEFAAAPGVLKVEWRS
jgi:putative Mg2+ transporter-C (MgtC) family protein